MGAPLEHIIKMKGVLDKANVPEGQRIITTTPEHIATVLGMSTDEVIKALKEKTNVKT